MNPNWLNLSNIQVVSPLSEIAGFADTDLLFSVDSLKTGVLTFAQIKVRDYIPFKP